MGFSLFTDLLMPTKYEVPDWRNIDPTQVQLDTIKGNVASLDAAKGLASDFNDFMRQQLQKANEAGVPGFSAITSQLSKNLQSQLGGQLGLSDLAATQRRSAASALAGGVAGSPFGAALTARDIGLRQYQVQQAAQAQAPGYLSTVAGLTRAPMFDFSSVFMTPQQRIDNMFKNQQAQWNVQNLKNQLAVQPEPWQKALAGFGDSLVNAATSYFTMGGGLGGMGGGGFGGGGTSVPAATAYGNINNSFFGGGVPFGVNSL